MKVKMTFAAFERSCGGGIRMATASGLQPRGFGTWKVLGRGTTSGQKESRGMQQLVLCQLLPCIVEELSGKWVVRLVVRRAKSNQQSILPIGGQVAIEVPVVTNDDHVRVSEKLGTIVMHKAMFGSIGGKLRRKPKSKNITRVTAEVKVKRKHSAGPHGFVLSFWELRVRVMRTELSKVQAKFNDQIINNKAQEFPPTAAKTTKLRGTTITAQNTGTPKPDENAYPIPAAPGTNRTEGHIAR
jgi:hypothetical protein